MSELTTSASLVTSGLLLVPDLPAAAGATLHIFVRSFAPDEAVVPYRINQAQPDGEKAPLRRSQLKVPGDGVGMAQAVLRVPELARARWIEINLELPSSSFLPSAALAISFLADGTTNVEQWIGPTDFARR